MQTIEAYQAVDGKIFTDEKEAKKHDIDCIGEQFDGLLQIAMRGDKRGNITRIDQHAICSQLLNDRKEAKKIIDILSSYLELEN